MRYIKSLADLSLAFYETHARYSYAALLAATFFVILLTWGVNPGYVSQPTPSLSVMITVSLVASGVGILFLLGDLLRLGVKPTPTYKQLVRRLRQEELIDQVVTARLELIKAAEHPPDERSMIAHLEEIMAIVQGEWKFFPIIELIRLSARVAMIVVLYTLISMNLTYCLQAAIFNTLEPFPDWLFYLYNTVVAMFLGGYGVAFPVHSLARVLAIAEILSGVFALVVVFDSVLTGTYQDMGSFRDAMHSHLILAGTSGPPPAAR